MLGELGHDPVLGHERGGLRAPGAAGAGGSEPGAPRPRLPRARLTPRHHQQELRMHRVAPSGQVGRGDSNLIH